MKRDTVYRCGPMDEKSDADAVASSLELAGKEELVTTEQDRDRRGSER